MTTTAAFLKERASAANHALHPTRRSAFQYLSEQGFPTSHEESWKYTRLAPILAVPFQQAPPGADHRLSVDAIDQLAGHFSDTRLIFVNGHFSHELSSIGSLSDGVCVTHMATLPQDDPTQGMMNSMLPGTGAQAHPFEALNTALSEDGALIRIPKNIVVQEPISLIFLCDVGETPLMSHPRVWVVAEPGSCASIIEVYTGILNHLYFTNTVMNVQVKEGAEITRYKIQNEAEKAFHLSRVNVHQARGSRFVSHGVAWGAAIGREEINVALTAPEAEVALNGLYLPHQEQYLDHPVLVDHLAPHCKSHQFYKGVMTEKGRGGFYGQIVVQPGAMKTDAGQTNKNLLLSETAQVDTRPRLEIFADDVKCAHGAAVGQLDEEAVFYLCSRGLPQKEARGVLTYAFANEMADRMPLMPVRSYVKQMLSTRFGNISADTGNNPCDEYTPFEV
jgi:Fe-S cluster assembly protein SufD